MMPSGHINFRLLHVSGTPNNWKEGTVLLAGSIIEERVPKVRLKDFGMELLQTPGEVIEGWYVLSVSRDDLAWEPKRTWQPSLMLEPPEMSTEEIAKELESIGTDLQSSRRKSTVTSYLVTD
jgi:hypothetical protein